MSTIFEYSELDMRSKFRTSLQFETALRLVTHFGIVAANVGPEDTAGRATMVLQSPAEVVARAVSIAELLIAESEARGWLAAGITDDEAAARRAGELGAAKDSANWEADRRLRDLVRQIDNR